MDNLKEEDIVFQKTYDCPVCYKEFKTLTVRAGKIYSRDMDEDLRPIYKDIDPLKYEAIVCPHCGYAALSRYFDQLMPLQVRYLRESVPSKYKGLQYSTDKYSYDEAIRRYKMVILSDEVEVAKNSRKAYTYLKFGWLIRSKLEHEGETLSGEIREQLQKEELENIENAYDKYLLAFSSETFPMSGMDELTLTVLVAELAYKIGKYDESLRTLSKVFENRNAPRRVKDKAYYLKERIRSQQKAQQSKEENVEQSVDQDKSAENRLAE